MRTQKCMARVAPLTPSSSLYQAQSGVKSLSAATPALFLQRPGLKFRGLQGPHSQSCYSLPKVATNSAFVPAGVQRPGQRH